MLVRETVVRHNMARVQTDLAQDVFAVDALMAEIVKRETDARVTQAEMLINFV